MRKPHLLSPHMLAAQLLCCQYLAVQPVKSQDQVSMLQHGTVMLLHMQSRIYRFLQSN